MFMDMLKDMPKVVYDDLSPVTILQIGVELDFPCTQIESGQEYLSYKENLWYIITQLRNITDD